MQEAAKMNLTYEIDDSMYEIRKEIILAQLEAKETLSEGEYVQLKQELLGIESKLTSLQQQSKKENRSSGMARIESQATTANKRKQYLPTVVERIEKYKIAEREQSKIKTWIEELKLLMAPGETSITPNYGGMPGGSGLPMSKVEAAVMEPYEELAKLQRNYFQNMQIILEMERALNELNELEKEIIQKKYLDTQSRRQKVSDKYLIDLFSYGKTQFYEIQGGAIDKLAKALRII